MYSISIKLGDQVYESKGSSMNECLSTLPQPLKVSQKGIATLRRDDSIKEILLMPHKLRKVWYKSSPVFLGKQWELLVK